MGSEVVRQLISLSDAKITVTDASSKALNRLGAEQGGEEVQYVYDLVADSVSRGTATPAAMTALMILDGKVKEKGVLPPEGALDINLFFSEAVKEAQVREREIRARSLS